MVLRICVELVHSRLSVVEYTLKDVCETKRNRMRKVKYTQAHLFITTVHLLKDNLSVVNVNEQCVAFHHVR